MERIVIYTYVSNGRKPVDVRNPYKNVDFFVLSKDVITRNINGWTPLNCSRYIDANGEENFKDVIFNNPFLYFKNYDYAIYVDPSTVFTHSPLNGLRSFKESRNNVLRKPNVTYFRNGESNCIKCEENVQEEMQEEINVEEMFGYYDENDNFIEDKEYINCMEKIVLYTYSKYGDLPVRIKNKYKNVDVVLISKALTVGELNGWKVLNCKDAIEKKGKDGFEKILYERPFEIFKEYKYAIFVQPNLKYQRSPLSYLKTFIDKKLNVLRKDNIICFKNNNYKPKQLYKKSVNKTNVKDNDVAIYVAASKSDKKTNIVNNSSIRRYSWVNEGKELDSDYWCELAVIYDIWKKSKAKIVGLEHYRRFFVEPGWDGHSNDYKILEKDKIVSALNKYDVILARQYVPKGYISVGSMFTKTMKTKSAIPVIKSLLEYLKTTNVDFYKYLQSKFNDTGFYGCNMIICKKEIFDKYCEFAFGLINSFSKKYFEKNAKPKRIFGYLTEWLMGYWFEFNNYKILSTYKLVYKKDMTKVENSDWNAKTEKEKNEMFVACEKYKRSNELIKLQEVELDLMKKFDEVCKKHNINYFLIGGTLLGAARHKGFIPWDDDMDVAMLAKDYYKLLEVAKDEFNGKYFFQTEYSDPGALRYHAQLRNSETTGILKTDYMCRKKFNQGIFIDIFPFYTLPDDLKKRKEVFNYITPLLRNKNHANFVKYDNYLRNLNCNGHYCCPLWSPIVFKEITPIADVVKTIPYKFEDLMLPIPHNYNNVLVIKYGRNWRTPIKGKSIHGGLIVDTNKSYIEYIRKFN